MRRFVACAVVLISGAAACSGQIAPSRASGEDIRSGAAISPAYQPRMESSACWTAVPSGLNATCGYVVVPEDRSVPFTDGNSVRLAFMVLRAGRTRAPQPSTLLVGGGPGQDVVALHADLLRRHRSLLDHGYPPERPLRTLEDMRQFRSVMDRFVADLEKRDFVLFDQRGAGFSQPSLKCRGEDWRTCRRRLVRAGVDLRSYNTLENARDVNDVRRALGQERVNLHAGSYGTRLALEVLRQFPNTVRAAVLDGVAPPQISWSSEMVRRYDAALAKLFRHCAADAACNRAYPAIDSTFYDAVARLNRNPMPMRVGERELFVNGDDLRDLVWNGLMEVQVTRELPWLIARVGAGDLGPWSRLLEARVAEQPGEAISWGMHYAVDCAERLGFETRDDLVRASAGLNPVLREGVVQSFASTLRICDDWQVARLPANVRRPVESEVPVLLLSGELDPGTPPEFAEIAARTLPHHFSYVLPYLGHTDGFTSDCHGSLVSAFLDDPSQAPPSACVQQMERAPFVVR